MPALELLLWPLGTGQGGACRLGPLPGVHGGLEDHAAALLEFVAQYLELARLKADREHPRRAGTDDLHGALTSCVSSWASQARGNRTRYDTTGHSVPCRYDRESKPWNIWHAFPG